MGEWTMEASTTYDAFQDRGRGAGLIQYGFSKLLTKLHKLRYWDTVQVLSSE